MPDENGLAPESASLIAARQLAEDAHRRRMVADRRRRYHALVIPPLPAGSAPED